MFSPYLWSLLASNTNVNKQHPDTRNNNIQFIDYTTDININPNPYTMYKSKQHETHMKTRKHNKVTETMQLNLDHFETTLHTATRRTLAQLSKTMPHLSFICKQIKRRPTPITTMPHLQNRTTHDNTVVQLHQNNHLAQGHIFVDGFHGRVESVG